MSGTRLKKVDMLVKCKGCLRAPRGDAQPDRVSAVVPRLRAGDSFIRIDTVAGCKPSRVDLVPPPPLGLGNAASRVARVR